MRPAVLATLFVLGLPSLATAGPDVPFESLPPAVQATVTREVKSGRVTEVERDTRRGVPIFEIEFVDGTEKWELDVAIDGTLLEKHRD